MTATKLQGRYRIDGLLGTGKVASVHLGYDEQLEDPVAIKLLAHNHALDPDMRDRFVTEAQLLRRVDSPHVVRVHDMALSDDGRPFLVLQYCDRGSLADRIEQAWAHGWQASEADLTAIAVPLAAAITALAHVEVVHRHLTPSKMLFTTTPRGGQPGPPPNSLLAADERLVVTDLGLCQDLALSTRLTGGTERFRAPEQRTVGGSVQPRTDVWAAAAVLVWMATGEHHDSPVTATVALTKTGMSAAMVHAITAGLQPHPAQRPHPAEWAAAITAAAPPVRQPQPRWPTRLLEAVRRRLASGRLPRPLGRVGRLGVTLVVAIVALWVLTTALRWGDAMLYRHLADDDTEQTSSQHVPHDDPTATHNPHPNLAAEDPTPRPAGWELATGR